MLRLDVKKCSSKYQSVPFVCWHCFDFSLLVGFSFSSLPFPFPCFFFCLCLLPSFFPFPFLPIPSYPWFLSASSFRERSSVQQSPSELHTWPCPCVQGPAPAAAKPWPAELSWAADGSVCKAQSHSFHARKQDPHDSLIHMKGLRYEKIPEIHESFMNTSPF